MEEDNWWKDKGWQEKAVYSPRHRASLLSWYHCVPPSPSSSCSCVFPLPSLLPHLRSCVVDDGLNPTEGREKGNKDRREEGMEEGKREGQRKGRREEGMEEGKESGTK